ncbi:MAG: histidinol dehydrogenase [Minicystis sp.]
MSLSIPLFTDGTPEFDAVVARLEQRGSSDLEAVTPAVQAIIARVRREGDAGVRACIQAFEKRSVGPLVRRDFDGEAALRRLDPPLREALQIAAQRIDRYHQRQRMEGFVYEEEGVLLGMKVRPLARVGVYAPGGKARYPSSVLMTAIPARVAGVKDIVLATPDPDDRLLAAAHLAGVRSILDAGGAQAIAALAYGTPTIRPVQKIFGPGNAYVVEAKRQVFGQVAIDLLPGPSEILVLADASANPAWIAADLLAQAEHGKGSSILFVTNSAKLLKAVEREIATQLTTLRRQEHLAGVIDHDCALILVKSLKDAVSIANDFAPEHISIVTKDDDTIAAQIHTAGAIFLGGYSPVAAGDFLAGPSHTLPTGGAGKSFSGLTVDMFQRRTSLIRLDARALKKSVPTIAKFSAIEGLDAHGRSAAIRFE